MANKYTYSPPFSEEELYDAYVTQGLTQAEVAEKFGTSQKVVWRALGKMEIPARKAAKRDQRGEKNSSWKGGRVLVAASSVGTRFSDAGYWYVKNPDHPNATKHGYVAEHIVVATETIGRPLEKGECVHHKDALKHNNAPENLHVCTLREHRELHLQLDRATYRGAR